MAYPSFIGTLDWNPMGESIGLVANKISMFNHFSNDEANEALKNISHSTIEEKARWPTGILRASFKEYYFPNNNTSLTNLLPPVQQVPHFRFCLKCAEEGVHLFLHQLDDCLCCPMHRTPLISHCPNCKKLLRSDGFLHLERTPFSCVECSWQGWNPLKKPTNKSVNLRVTILKEFREWIEEIQNLFIADDEDRFLLSQPALFQNLANVHALVPGPDWIENSIVDIDRIKTRTYRIKGSLSNSIYDIDETYEEIENRYYIEKGLITPSDGMEQAVLNVFDPNKHIEINSIHRLQLEMVSIINKTEPEVEKLYAGLQVQSDLLKFCYEEFSSVFATGYYMWRSWAFSYLPKSLQHHNRYCNLADNPDFYFRALWRAGPAKLLSLYPEEDYCNHDVCLEICKIWENTMVRDWLSLYVIRAAIFRENRYIDLREYSMEPAKMGGLPVIIVEKKPKTIQIKVATTLDTPNTILDYAKSLKNGFSRQAVHNEASYDDLFRLGGISQTDQKICLDWAKTISKSHADGKLAFNSIGDISKNVANTLYSEYDAIEN